MKSQTLKPNSLLKPPLFCLVLFCFFSNRLSAQCPLICNNSVQASLNLDCLNEVTWDALLEGAPSQACINELVVSVYAPDGSLIPSSPTVTVAQLNQVLTGKVSHPTSGQSCTTQILVEDKLPPTVLCVDTLLTCFQDTSPAVIGYPVHYDNCTSIVELTYFDQNTVFNCTHTDTILIINRQWTAVDTSGNNATCWQKVYIERPPLDSMQFPQSLDNIGAPALYCTTGNTDPIFTGVPMHDSLSIDSICGYTFEYEDVQVPICDGSYTIFRNWTIYDGCGLSSKSEEQTINVMDTIAPALTCPVNFVAVVPNNGCLATANIPQPSTLDSCSSDITVFLEGSFGLIQGMQISDLAIGVYSTTCHATDDCGNTSSCQFNINIKDETPPVAVGISSPIVSLLPNGITYLPAVTFDGGSWDNCDNLIITARRLDTSHCINDDGTDFNTEVPFYCCDAGSVVEVELRVMDLSGNIATVSTSVHVEDNITPIIHCPDPVTLECSQDYEDLNLTGEPSIEDNCSGYSISMADSIYLDVCGAGTIDRHWSVEDAAGTKTTCIQHITKENQTPFTINLLDPDDPNDDVVWPKNYISDTCGAGLDPDELPSEYGSPIIFTDDHCQMIATSYSDTYLSQPNNACIEILRSWTVVDWCQFNQVTYEGSWQYGQILRIQNSAPPVIHTDCVFEEFCSFDAGCQTGPINLSIEVSDDCNDLSQLAIKYEVDFNDDGDINLSGSQSNVQGDLPFGVHRIFWKVSDGCMNETTCDYLFSVVDCSNPTPVCKALIVEISDDPTPFIEIPASKFDEGSLDNCTEATDLLFSYSANQTDSLLRFECDDIGTQDIEIWVSDAMNNQSFCQTQVTIQDNNFACSTAAVVSGSIALDNGDAVNNVQVFLSNFSDEDSVTTMTNGLFSFPNVLPGLDYTITPYKNTDPLNGVTTYDLVLISKHILGVQALDTPYQIIAADANRSGAVTTLDMVHIRKIILNIDQAFPNNTTWRFVRKDYIFDNPLDPLSEDFPEVTNINNLGTDFMADFIALKVGDANNSVDVTQ